VSAEVITRIKNIPTAHELEAEPDFLEVDSAINALINNKALKQGGTSLKEALWEITCRAWRSGTIPKDWRDAAMITIFKKR